MPDGPAPLLSRRRLLAGAAGGAVTLVAGGEAYTHRTRLKDAYRHLTGACGDDGPVPPDGHAQVRDGHLATRHLRGGADWTLSVPHGHRLGDPIAVLFSLHGRGGRARDPFDSTHLHDIAAQQRLPLAIAGITAGDTYYHRRVDGQDALAALLEDFVPFVQERYGLGAGGRGRAIHGISMGGFGAALAAETRPRLFRALIVSSGALWTSRADQRAGVPDAFDSDADFAAHDVVGGAARLGRMPVRVDCGADDPYVGADRALAAAVGPRCVASFPKGCHDSGFWRRVAPAQVAFAGRALGLRPA